MLRSELLETIGQSTIIILLGLLQVAQVSVQSATCSCNMLRSEHLQRASMILVAMVEVTQLDVYLGVVYVIATSVCQGPSFS